MKQLLAAYTVVLALSASAEAQEIIGIGHSGLVYRINAGSGAGFSVGYSGSSGHNAMAKRSDGTLFVAGGSGGTSTPIFTLDPTTGLTSHFTDVALGSIRGLAFGPLDELYAVNDPAAPFAGADDLHTIDLSTGAAPLIGPIGFWGVQALAYLDGDLYAWDCGPGTGTGAGLIRIDPSTGAGTNVNPAVPGTCGDVQGLMVSPCGVLYGGSFNLKQVNPQTGVISSFGGGFDVRGLEFIGSAPAPFCTSKPSSIANCTPTLSITSDFIPKGSPTSVCGTAGPVPGGGNPGILVFSKVGVNPSPPLTPFGHLCVSSFLRAGNSPLLPGGTSGSCSGSYAFDVKAIVNGLPQINAGDTTWWQLWYRDALNPGGANFTNGVGPCLH